MTQNSPSTTNSDELADPDVERLLQDYYTRYYRDELGLKDWQSRVTNRLHEEDTYCKRYIDYLCEWFAIDLKKLKIMVVGFGTGGELVVFNSLGADVHGVETNSYAYKIGLAKSKNHQIKDINLYSVPLEETGIHDETFDLVYCQTVIEHVDDVETSIKEMIRVTKIGGLVFIGAPDYRQWWEPHYKLPLPMFLPRILLKIALRYFGRPTQFLDSLNMVTSRQLTNLFMNENVTAFQVVHSWKESWKSSPRWHERLQMLTTKLFSIHRDQIWVLRKTHPR